MNDADVIIVGSGPAGVSAAWPLVQAGVRVLMLDASQGAMPEAPNGSLAALRNDPARWRTELGAAGPIADAGVSPKFATPLARAVLAGSGGIEADNFMSVGSHAAGGLSRIWGALAARYGADEQAALPGIAESYDRVAERIGISGGLSVADADPASLAPPVAHLAKRHRDAEGFSLVTAPNAVLDQRRADRDACNRCGLCLLGCSRGSIYHSALELPALRRHANFAYRSGVTVERLSGQPGAQVVETRAGTFHAPVVILAAGTLATTGLALRRIGLMRVPVRLESNPVAAMAFLVPQLIGRDLPAKSFGLGQLFYTLQPEPGVEAAGVFYGADTLPLAPVADRLPFTRPTALRAARALAPALLLATAYLPGRFSDNGLSVDEHGRIRIHGNQTDEADRLLRETGRQLGKLVRARGAFALPGALQVLQPGADAHPGATLPMGGRGPGSTSMTGELNGAPGVFVADGAALPLLSARHPTLTIMANADRIGRTLAQRLTARTDIAHAG